MKMHKKGVSLIAVLLFMMIATIAATGTYKWLTSEGRSSASRMQMNEARYAAIAGLDAARTWIAYNGNDFGAVVKQYFDNGKKPVFLNDVLNNLGKPELHFNVWLVGVDKEHSTYKIKLLSTVEALNGSKYTEAAILNVSGLYQVKLPVASAPVKTLDFNEALYAGTSGGVSLDVSSAIINGNLTLNTDVDVSDHLIVTGDLNGNSNSHIKDLYVQGRMLACTNFNVTGNAYIKEDVYLNGVVRFNNLYADGGLDWRGEGAPADAQCQTGVGTQFTASGKVTVNGDLKMPTHTAGGAPGELGSYIVDGDLVVKNGRMLFPSIDVFKANGLYLASHYTANFSGNVFIENGIEGTHFPYNRRADAVKLGSAGKKVYTGSAPLYKVSDNGPVAGAPEKGKIVYKHWIDEKIAADGKYHKDTDATWCETDRLGCTWGGKIPAEKMPPKNTYCNSDKCAPTFVNDLSMQPDFWQSYKFYDVLEKEVTETRSEEYETCNCCGNNYGSCFNRPLHCLKNNYNLYGQQNCCYCEFGSIKTNTRTITETKTVCYSDYPGNKGCVRPDGKPWHCVCTEYDRYRAEAFVQVNGAYSNTAPDTTGWGADKLQEYADAIQEPSSDNCNTKNIPAPIQFNQDLLNSPFMHSADNRGACQNVGIANEWYTAGGLFEVNGNSERWSMLEECYNLAQSHGELYQDEWLLIKVSGASDQFNQPRTAKMTKKYIIIFEEATQAVQLPQTDVNSMILMYLTQGGTVQIPNGSPSDVRNYFIYSDGDIHYNNPGNQNISGSIFLNDCHHIESINVINADFNATLVNSLASIAAICDNDGSGKCSIHSSEDPSEGSGGETSSTPASNGYDEYFIATSPQLGLSLETQYKSDESEPTSINQSIIAPSAIVLPRIIYLNQDAKGTLSDYYNVIALNGSTEVKDPSKMSCPAAIHTTGKLYDGTPIPKSDPVYTCTYDDKIPFYVVVTDAAGERPKVSFSKNSEELLPGGSTEVKLHAPNGNQQITVSISVPSQTALPSGWDYETKNNVVLKRDDGTNSLYSVTYTPGATDLPIFSVSTETSAAQGDIVFQIVECDGCDIQEPWYERVFINGIVSINREEIESYCSQGNNAETFEGEFGVSCSEVINRVDCGFMMASGAQWVTANGIGCVYESKNESWRCNTGSTISLQNLITSNENCEAFVPYVPLTEMNIGQTYSLPATLKRKKAKLTLKLVGNQGSGSVKVRYHRPGITTEGSFSDWEYSPCNGTNEICVIDMYVNDQISLLGQNGSDIFNYWICSGNDCNEEPGTNVNADSYVITLKGDNEIEAHFNEKDIHCIYNDFKNTTSFCTSDVEDCIDRCKTGTNCSVTDETNYPNANWVMVHANDKCKNYTSLSCVLPVIKPINEEYFTAPKVNKSEGSIVSANDGLSSTLAASVILSRIQAGYNGTMTAMFSVPTLADNAWDKITNHESNDGFILRSNANATEYYSLNVVSGTKTRARLCYVTGRDNNKNYCTEAYFTGSLNGQNIMLTKLTNATISITLNNNMISATLSYVLNGTSFGSGQVSFDLSAIDIFKNHLLADNTNQYIGFKFDSPALLEGWASTSFKIYDLAWKTSTTGYESSCWDTPSVTCSFKASAQADGGFIPADPKTATPWVAMSSWFNDKSCKIDYYYNGCDVPSEMFENERSILSYFTNDKNACVSGNGLYYRTPMQLYSFKEGHLKSSEYKFTTEGLHGYTYTGSNGSGYVNDASVIVTCTSEGNPHVYDARCGEFTVGRKELCSESYAELLSNDYNTSCSGNGECSPTLKTSTPINARNADIRVTIENLNSGSVSIYLVSDGGILSQEAVSVNATGEKQVVIIKVGDNLSTASGFNPQKITGIVFVGKETVSGYKVSHIQSVCPYAFSISCPNKPTYSERSGKWHVTANVIHPEQAAYCMVTPLGDAQANNVKAPDEQQTSCAGFAQDWILMNAFGMGSPTGEGYKFRVSAYDSDGNIIDECETPSKELPNVSVTCSVSASEKKEGEGIPSFNFTISNCPDDGCEYAIINPNGSRNPTGSSMLTYTTTVEGYCPNNDCSSSNTTLQPYSTGLYKYDIEVYGKKCPTDGSNEFEIKEATQNVTCEAFVEDGKFIATTNSENWNGILTYTDVLGINPNPEHVSGGTRFEKTLPSAGPGHYTMTLTLPGENSCAADWTIEKPIPDVTLNCPSSISDFDGSSSFTPTVRGCEDGCTWSSTLGSVSPASSYTGGEVILSGITADGDVTLTVSNSDKSANCTISVTVKQESTKPSFSCPSDGISVTNQLPSQNVSVNLTDVIGCSEGCSWHISGGNTASGALSGTSFSFAHNNGTEFWLKLYNDEDSDQCKVTVSYKQKPTFNCPSGKTTFTGSDVAIEPTNIQNCSQGCTYNVNGGSANLTKTGNTTSGGSYNIGNVSESVSSDQTFNYTVTISNDVGTNEIPCTVPVKFTATAATESADCHYSGTNFYVGEKISIYASDFKPSKQSLPIAFAMDGTVIDNNYGNAFYTELGQNYPYSGKVEYKFTSAGQYRFTLTLNGTVVCDQPITVNSRPSNWKSVDGEFDLAPGTWVLSDCYGSTGGKTLQTSNGSSDNCLSWFSPKPSWTNKWGTCAGQASATFPLTVTVPAGESIRIGGCY